VGQQSKTKLIQLINEIKELDSSFNSEIELVEVVDLEAKLNDEHRKSILFIIVIVFSILVTIAVLTLLFLVAFGKASLEISVLIPLSLEPVSAVLSFFYILVKHYWPSKT
jgi:hypothetical protein